MLGEVLHAVVHDGAGVSFVVPFERRGGPRVLAREGIARRARRHAPGARGAFGSTDRWHGPTRSRGPAQPATSCGGRQTPRASHGQAPRHRSSADGRARAGRTISRKDAAHARHLDGRQRRAVVSVTRLRRGRRHPAICERLPDARARTDDDHVQRAHLNGRHARRRTIRDCASAPHRHCPSEARFREAGKRPALILSLRSRPRRVRMRVGDTCQAH